MLEERAMQTAGAAEAAIAPEAPERQPFNSAFGVQVEAARLRMERYRTLIDQLSLALRLAEGPEGIDRATLPLSLPLGPSKLKELGALLRLSPFLKADLQALIAIYRVQREELRRMERVAELERERPDLVVSTRAENDARYLFTWLGHTRERFKAYPTIQALLTTEGSAEELTRVVPQAVPDGLEDYFTPAESAHRKLMRAVAATTDLAPSPSPEAQAGWRERLEDGWRGVQAALKRWMSPVEVQPEPSAEAAPRQLEPLMQLLGVPPLRLDIGLDLVSLVEPSLGGDLLTRIAAMRERVTEATGFIVPSIVFHDSLHLPDNGYEIRVREHVVARGELMTGFFAAIQTQHTDLEEPLVGFSFTEPAAGRQAYWVPASALVNQAVQSGYEVEDPASLLVAHLEEAVIAHAHDILSYDELKVMLDSLAERHPTVVEHVRGRMDFAEVHQVLRALLRERVSIRDLSAILERLGHLLVFPHVDIGGQNPGLFMTVHLDATDQTVGRQVERLERVLPRQQAPLDTPALVEALRQAMAREICAALADAADQLDVVTLAPDLETQLIEAVVAGREPRIMGLTPQVTERVLAAFTQTCRHLEVPIVVCDARLRPALKRFTARALPRLHVLSHAELHPQFRVQTVSTIGWDRLPGARET